MHQPTRQEIFAQAAQKLRRDFDELSVVPHNAVKGGEAEKLIRRFLNDHLPKRFTAGAGFIIDPRDEVSRQTDVVVYDAFNCPVYRASDDAGIFPSDNVAAVVEVKATLDKQQLTTAFENITAAKRLLKTKVPEVPFLVQTQTLGCLFAFNSAITLDTLAEHYDGLLRASGLGHHIDLVTVLDRGILSLAAKIRGNDGWSPALWEGIGGPGAEGAHIGISVQDLGYDSLDAFLRLLLAHLTFFRKIVPHPGFNWYRTNPQSQSKLRYLTSFTLEQDPERRRQKLEQYRNEVREELARYPAAAPE